MNGVELHYTDSEAGRSAVFLLHGGMGDLETWPHQVRALSPRWRVIAYSRRHSHPNRNDAAPRTVSANGIDDDIDDFLALQAALDAGPSHLVATSYGALLALGIALRAPDRVASLVLAEPPLHRWALATESGARLYRAFIDGVWCPAGQAFARGEPRYAIALLTEGMWGRPTLESWPAERVDGVLRNAPAMQALTRADDPFPEFDRATVSRLNMPTLLLRGAHTSALHRHVVDELSGVMRHAQRIEIPRAGHGSPNENPAAFNAEVIAFLESLPPPRPPQRNAAHSNDTPDTAISPSTRDR
ncbi:MAG: alpha/beta hydrolase [Caldimonas sp.]